MAFVLLDRDGVINFESGEYIKSPEEWRPIPGSLSAIAKLNAAGFKVCLATNQSGIGRGLYDMAMLEQIHDKLHKALALRDGRIERIFFCPHRPDEGCPCRKPKPGLLYQARDTYDIDLSQTFFIGDSLTDIEAAQTAGCMPLLVLTGNGELARSRFPILYTVPTFPDLAKACEYVLSQQKKPSK